MLTVQEATQLIAQVSRNFGNELLPIHECTGRVLAQSIYADRDMPAYDRVTMDGIALNYNDWEKGQRSFRLVGTQAAGQPKMTQVGPGNAIEIMTGAILPDELNTIIPYEQITISDGLATFTGIQEVKQGQFIHRKGSDKQQGALLAHAGIRIGAAIINAAATTGYHELLVNQLPKIAIIATGDELVPVEATPAAHQIRTSNSYAIQSALATHGLSSSLYHLKDNEDEALPVLKNLIEQYDVLLLSGGVSMGKYDFLPIWLQRLGVEEIFHKVRQRPGKPLWFGAKERGPVVFGFPGNPVSAFMCTYRYFLPWVQGCMGHNVAPVQAQLAMDVHFEPALSYFLPVSANVSADGRIIATPVAGNGSGDLANLLAANGFMELPSNKNTFMAGEVYPVWLYQQLRAADAQLPNFTV
ncbi:MAG: molybdopterin molybdenumtransferase MoeA [Chitinophagia bacterium]|nr:molybdopterin molybdenumtransferase MoeA [Chitinophagia bacterium]